MAPEKQHDVQNGSEDRKLIMSWDNRIVLVTLHGAPSWFMSAVRHADDLEELSEIVPDAIVEATNG